MITVTPEAAKQILAAATQSNAEHMALRIAAKKNPDGSFEYGMGFDDTKDDDMVFQSEGVEVLIRPEHGPLLKGTTLHWAEVEPGQQHFIVLNPNDPNFVPPGEDGGGCNSGGCNSGGCGSGGCSS